MFTVESVDDTVACLQAIDSELIGEVVQQVLSWHWLKNSSERRISSGRST